MTTMYSQEPQLEESQRFLDFKGTASITNNGISLVPSFSLGDPALLLDLKFTKNRISFEPDMRFALEGKPWSFLFWFRYKAVQKERFSLRLGAHPALNYRTIQIMRNGDSEEIIESRRYVAAEVVPSYKISEKVSIGMYYLLAHGFDNGVKTTNFLTLNAAFSKLYLKKKYYLNVSPQVYFLSLDELTGYYAVAFLSVARDNFPISMGAIFNKAIDTQILPEQDFTWNISLNYRFPEPRRN